MKHNIRTFFGVFTVCICILIIISGVLIVEGNTRRRSMGIASTQDVAFSEQAATFAEGFLYALEDSKTAPQAALVPSTWRVMEILPARGAQAVEWLINFWDSSKNPESRREVSGEMEV